MCNGLRRKKGSGCGRIYDADLEIPPTMIQSFSFPVLASMRNWYPLQTATAPAICAILGFVLLIE